MKGRRERINVAKALRLMIKQIAVPLQILTGGRGAAKSASCRTRCGRTHHREIQDAHGKPEFMFLVSVYTMSHLEMLVVFLKQKI